MINKLRIKKNNLNNKQLTLNKEIRLINTSFNKNFNKQLNFNQQLILDDDENFQLKLYKNFINDLNNLNNQKILIRNLRNLIKLFKKLKMNESLNFKKSLKDLDFSSLLKNLNSILNVIEIPNKLQLKSNIEKLCENFENYLLKLFDKFYRKGNPKFMSICSINLFKFNNGSSCIQLYVNQHDFFISKNKIFNSNDQNFKFDDQIWLNINNANIQPPKHFQSLVDLCNDIKLTVDQEAQIIQAVFPYPSIVFQVFLQRIFAQLIQSHLESLLIKASSISNLSYLRLLHLSYLTISNLVQDLKYYDNLSTINNYHISSFIPPPGTHLGNNGISILLDQSLDELFVPYLDNYVHLECKSLTELYEIELSPFKKFHQSYNSNKSISVLDRMVNQLPTNNYINNFNDDDHLINNHNNYNNNDNNNNVNNDTNQDGKLSLTLTQLMLKWHAESIGRCVDLSNQKQLSNNLLSLLRTLSYNLNDNYILTGLNSTINNLKNFDHKFEPNFNEVEILKPANLILQFWQSYSSNIITLLISSSTTTTMAIKRDIETFFISTISNLQMKFNNILQIYIDITLHYIQICLHKQKRNDFKPKDDDSSFARINTEPCLLSCEILNKFRDCVCNSLSGSNLDKCLIEIGVAFHG